MGYIKNVSLATKLNPKGKRWSLLLWKCYFLLWKDKVCMWSGILSMFYAFHGINQAAQRVLNWKRPCFLQQDPFTRTLYENEKITFWIITLLKYGYWKCEEKYCCELFKSCGYLTIIIFTKKVPIGHLIIFFKLREH